MRNLQIIEQDVAVFLNRSEELSLADKRELLLSMFKKHLTLMESDMSLNRRDFDTILSDAKDEYSKGNLPSKIGTTELSMHEVPNLILMESVFAFLNQKGVLRRTPKFNKT